MVIAVRDCIVWGAHFLWTGLGYAQRFLFRYLFYRQVPALPEEVADDDLCRLKTT
jgi:hypothetical protein